MSVCVYIYMYKFSLWGGASALGGSMKWLKVQLEAPPGAPEEEWSLELQMLVLRMEVLYFCTPPHPTPTCTLQTGKMRHKQT